MATLVTSAAHSVRIASAWARSKLHVTSESMPNTRKLSSWKIRDTWLGFELNRSLVHVTVYLKKKINKFYLTYKVPISACRCIIHTENTSNYANCYDLKVTINKWTIIILYGSVLKAQNYIETPHKRPELLQTGSAHIRGPVSYKDMAQSDLRVKSRKTICCWT